MSDSINRAAVLGAGVMGSGIAAVIANAGIPVILLDIVPNKLTPDEEDKGLTLLHPAVRNRIVNALFERAKKSTPPAFKSEGALQLVSVGNFEDDFDRLRDADWIIEVVVENLEIKQALMARIEQARKPGSIVTTNTSGIPITQIAAKCSPDLKARFLGTHFFNPPRVMKLLEVIPTANTSPEVVSFITGFAKHTLGKSIVPCNDTYKFVANRMNSPTASFNKAYAIDNGYTVEEVDAIVGPLVGRPKTAVFRLSDLVGIDLPFHANKDFYNAIPDDEDREVLRPAKMNAVVTKMIERGWLGNKAGQGFYKPVTDKEGKREFWVLNLETLEYEPPKEVRFESLAKAAQIESLPERLRVLTSFDDRAGRYVWAVQSWFMAYAAKRIPEIADSFISIDNAMKWGMAHEMGPFEIWDALGVSESARRMEEDGLRVARWVKEMVASGHATFYRYDEERKTGYYDLTARDYLPLP